MTDVFAGGGILVVVLGLAIVVLGAAIIYGIVMWRQARQNPVAMAAREEKTRENYESPEGQSP